MNQERTYICIDLKSFFASVECVERGLDPFITNLVVADSERSRSTICLAITPAMKALGIKNRCRIHEIPESIEYITAMPRMQLYIDYSAEIYSTYLRYVAPEDIHVYSIDECFIDVSKYLDLYQMSPREMAMTLIEAVMKKTGITASAGVGTNLYLAKIAMDIVAKKADEHIGILDEATFRRELWDYKPLSDFWRIGSGTVRRLAQCGIHTMGDIARASLHSSDWLYRQFGVDAELLIDHAWGIETCRMEDIKNYHSETHSLSSGQVLMRNYNFEEGEVIVKEMTDLLVLDLVEKNLMTESVTLHISYDHKLGVSSSHGSIHLGYATNSTERIVQAVHCLYRKIADRFTGIRRFNITCNNVIQSAYVQYDLFTDSEERERERRIQETMIRIRNRFGKNAILRGCNLIECSTQRQRNRQIGGHWA